MGILNVTPDSFYALSRSRTADEVARRAAQIAEEGAAFVDVGACSTRPGEPTVDEATELSRLRMAMKIVRATAPDAFVSVDTFRASVARVAVEELGADMINDVAGGTLDAAMADTVARLRVPYVLMHMRGTPRNMQEFTDYSHEGGVVAAVIGSLSRGVAALESRGVADIIVDPGFGFSKTVAQNFEMLRHIGSFAAVLRRPVLTGVSRKSMFWRPLATDPEHVLAATTAAHTIALTGGTSFLRVHDVADAVQAVRTVAMTYDNPPTP